MLGWNDIEIKANREFLRKDKEFAWELAQIEAAGPGWKAAQTQAQNAASEAEGGAGAGALPGGPAMPGGAAGGPALPPEFGGAAATGETASAGAPVAPEGAGAAPTPEAPPAA